MEKETDILKALFKRYPVLERERENILATFAVMERCFAKGGKLLVCGNGGSAADADHIVGELMKGFRLNRPCSAAFGERLRAIGGDRGRLLSCTLQGALPAISLQSNTALQTAYLNDVGFSAVAQAVYGYGREGDVLFCITTSGNSENLIDAAICAKAMNLAVCVLTGESGGKIVEYADTAIRVAESSTFRIQELHLPVYHALCLMLENKFFGSRREDISAYGSVRREEPFRGVYAKKPISEPKAE